MNTLTPTSHAPIHNEAPIEHTPASEKTKAPESSVDSGQPESEPGQPESGRDSIMSQYGDATGAGAPSQSASTSENTHTAAPAASEGIDKEDNAENRPYLGTVSLPSAVHHEENLGKKYEDMSNQPWGFSISPKAQQQQDVNAINEHINKYNSGQSVADSPVTHKPASDGKTEYSIEGRTYSTHSDTAQLYPVSGPGISTGQGPGDMYHLLKQNGKLTDVSKIRLNELHQGMQGQAYQEQAQNKIAGGHRSGVSLPKPKRTAGGNINKMNPQKLKPLLAQAQQRMDSVPISERFSNQLGTSTKSKK